MPTEVAKRLGLPLNTVHKMVQPSYKPFITEAKYFSDIERGGEWFENLRD